MAAGRFSFPSRVPWREGAHRALGPAAGRWRSCWHAGGARWWSSGVGKAGHGGARSGPHGLRRASSGSPQATLARPMDAGAEAMPFFRVFTGDVAGEGAVLDGGAAAMRVCWVIMSAGFDVHTRAPCRCWSAPPLCGVSAAPTVLFGGTPLATGCAARQRLEVGHESAARRRAFEAAGRGACGGSLGVARRRMQVVVCAGPCWAGARF